MSEIKILNGLVPMDNKKTVMPSLEDSVKKTEERLGIGGDIEIDYVIRGNYTSALIELNDRCIFSNNSIHPALESGKGLYRPLTLKETIETQVNDFNREYDYNGKKRSMAKRSFTFKHPITTSSSIAYNPKNNYIKFTKICPILTNLDCQYDNLEYFRVDYSIIDGEEFYCSEKKYKGVLLPGEVLSHEGILYLIDNNKVLLKELLDIIKQLPQLNKPKYMGFRLDNKSEIKESYIKPIKFFNLVYSSLNCNTNISGRTNFLRLYNKGAE
jgi:hypothetical protein